MANTADRKSDRVSAGAGGPAAALSASGRAPTQSAGSTATTDAKDAEDAEDSGDDDDGGKLGGAADVLEAKYAAAYAQRRALLLKVAEAAKHGLVRVDSGRNAFLCVLNQPLTPDTESVFGKLNRAAMRKWQSVCGDTFANVPSVFRPDGTTAKEVPIGTAYYADWVCHAGKLGFATDFKFAAHVQLTGYDFGFDDDEPEYCLTVGRRVIHNRAMLRLRRKANRRE